jgi:PAS domain S-box-containing protein
LKTIEPFLSPPEVCQLLIDGSHAFVRLFDGLIVAWTAGATELYGWTEEEAVGRKSHALLQTVFPASLAAMNAQLKAERQWKGELIHRKKDGTTVVVQSSWKLVDAREGDGEYIVELNHDITELAQAREQAAENENRLLLAKEVAHLGIWDWRADTNRTVCSGEWFDQHGRVRALQGPTYEEWLSWVHPEDRDRIAQLMKAALEIGTVYEAELRVIWPDGSIHWLHTKAQVLGDWENKSLHMIGANLDITDRKEFEERLLTLNRSLERSNEDLQRFAHVASHDLQSPLRTIRSLTQVVQRRLRNVLDEETAKLVAHIVQGADQMSTLVRDLLAFATATYDRHAPMMVDGKTALDRALASLQQAIVESDATITHGPLPSVKAHESHLLQLFQNLLGNAIQYHRPGVPPLIQVSAERRDGKWLFTVRDNGEGFDPAQASRIFEPFERLHGREVTGTGIGLTTCQRIVERYGGQIGAGSPGPGQGATFWFTLPAADGETTLAGESRQ